jgi:hypothetical protein
VLVGEAGLGTELQLVLSELLVRQGVAPEFERRERFRTSAFLSENAGDSSVWVFVTESGLHRARLYFRGPYGKRFLLRELTLRNGLDELGRELIAQVVETSAVALLRSEAGLSREEAQRDLSLQEGPRDALDEPEPAVPEPAPTKNEDAHRSRTAVPSPNDARRLVYVLAARGVEKWTGKDLGFASALGVETGLEWHMPRALFLRARVLFEYGLGQSLDAQAVSARIRTSTVQAGLDVGAVLGRNTIALGLSGGADLIGMSPDRATGTSLDLAADSTSVAPVMRLEGRYEVTFGSFRATAGILADVSLVDTHYDVRQGGEQSRIAAPWRVRPGVALTLGWCPTL